MCIRDRCQPVHHADLHPSFPRPPQAGARSHPPPRIEHRVEPPVPLTRFPVSYTHLDVYKRQLMRCARSGWAPTSYARRSTRVSSRSTGWCAVRRSRWRGSGRARSRPWPARRSRAVRPRLTSGTSPATTWRSAPCRSRRRAATAC